MKLNALLCSAVLATSMVTVAHADNTTHVAAASALGSIAGTAIGKSMGGTSGATIGAALGGAGGAAVASDRRHRTESAIGGGLGGGAGYTVGKSMGGTNGGYIGAALGAAGGSALGNKISKDRDADRSSKYWKKNTVIIVTNYRDEISLKTPSGVFITKILVSRIVVHSLSIY